MSEEAEIAAYRASRPRLSIEDVDADWERIGRDLADYVVHYADGHVEDVGPQSVHVCGSFATGEATEVVSDLDVRIVVDGIDQFLAEEIKESIKEFGKDVIPDECGFLDAHVDTEPPGDGYDSVCIWRFRLVSEVGSDGGADAGD